MKFFDLEMSDCLISGGRAVSYTKYNEVYCFNAQYTHGNSMPTCEVDRFKTSANQCKGKEESVHVPLHH